MHIQHSTSILRDTSISLTKHTLAPEQQRLGDAVYRGGMERGPDAGGFAEGVALLLRSAAVFGIIVCGCGAEMKTVAT